MSRRFLLFALLLAALPLLAGCPGGKAGANDVRLLISVPESQMDTWNETVKAFSDASKVTVSVENIPPDAYAAKLEGMVAGSAAPDVVSVPSTALPQLASAGHLTDLKPLLQAQRDVRPSDYFPTMIRAFQYQGGTYGLPYDVSIVAMAYNLDQFELQGIPEPTTEWTWQQYLQNAKRLTRDTNDDGMIDVWGTTASPWWQVSVWQSGGDLVDDPTNPQGSTLSTPEAQQALQSLADLSLKDKVAPGPGSATETGRIGLFAKGQAAMAYITREDVPVLNRTPDLRWGSMALPKGKLAANLGLCSGFCIPRNAAHHENAWKLLAFLASADGQKQLLNGSFVTPTLEALANSEYFPPSGVAKANAFADGLKVAHPLPFTPRYREIAAVWDEELSALWTGKATVQQVTAKIDERVNAILAQNKPATAWLLPLVPRG